MSTVSRTALKSLLSLKRTSAGQMVPRVLSIMPNILVNKPRYYSSRPVDNSNTAQSKYFFLSHDKCCVTELLTPRCL